MSFIAIIGAGPIGGAVAHKRAARGRVTQIRLIDSAGSIAQGKALDILQSGPVENFNASVHLHWMSTACILKKTEHLIAVFRK